MSDISLDSGSILEAFIVVLLIIAVASFLIGSIPFGYLISRFFFSTDIRKSGSGNIGAMNALRTIGKGGAIAVLLLDAAKGALPVLLCTYYLGRSSADVGQIAGSIAAAFAILGHCFSPWLGWKGGKGVATSLGAIFALAWPAGLVCVGVYLVAVLLTRYSSVGSILANIVAPFALFFFTRSMAEALYGIFAALLILWAHRENLGRLRTGSESPIKL